MLDAGLMELESAAGTGVLSLEDADDMERMNVMFRAAVTDEPDSPAEIGDVLSPPRCPDTYPGERRFGFSALFRG